jgi:hypothetical protein
VYAPASKLLKTPKVATRIAELREIAEERFDIIVQRIVQDLPASGFANADVIVGYCAVHLFERELDGRTVGVIRAEAGLLATGAPAQPFGSEAARLSVTRACIPCG